MFQVPFDALMESKSHLRWVSPRRVLRGLVAAGFGHSVLNICSPSDRQGTNGYICRPIAGTLHTPEFGVAFTNASRRASIVQAVLDICQKMAKTQAFDDLVMRPLGESKTIKW